MVSLAYELSVLIYPGRVLPECDLRRSHALQCHRTATTTRISGASLSALAYSFCFLTGPFALRHCLLLEFVFLNAWKNKKDYLRLSCMAPRGAVVDLRVSLVLNHSKHGGHQWYCALQFATVQAIASSNPAIAVERLGWAFIW